MNLPETGFLRLREIIGVPASPKKGIARVPGLIPVSKTVWWEGVKAGKYPAGVKLSAKITAWRAEDIRALIERLGMGGADEDRVQ